jgi:hypothetical protein
MTFYELIICWPDGQWERKVTSGFNSEHALERAYDHYESQGFDITNIFANGIADYDVFDEVL